MQILLGAVLQNVVGGAFALSSLAWPTLPPAPQAVPLASRDRVAVATGATSPTNQCLGTTNPDAVKIAWEQLKNPILQLPNHAAKDMAVRFVNGQWQMLFSYIGDRPFRFRIGWAQSPDLATWSTRALQVWDREESGGLASPDITQQPDGTYVAVFNTHDYDFRAWFSRSEEKLYYRTSTDFQTWSPMQRLVGNLWDERSDRLIDASLAYPSFGPLAAFKKGRNSLHLAYAPNGSLDGPWVDLGAPQIPGGLENYQFLMIDGVPHLLGTTLTTPPGHQYKHLPALYRLVGDPAVPTNWLNWELVSIFSVPQEAWNGGKSDGKRHELANSAFLCDARAVDGYFYLFYAGSNEVKRFNGRGYAAIGVARSQDLQTWAVP